MMSSPVQRTRCSLWSPSISQAIVISAGGSKPRNVHRPDFSLSIFPIRVRVVSAPLRWNVSVIDEGPSLSGAGFFGDSPVIRSASLSAVRISQVPTIRCLSGSPHPQHASTTSKQTIFEANRFTFEVIGGSCERGRKFESNAAAVIGQVKQVARKLNHPVHRESRRHARWLGWQSTLPCRSSKATRRS